MELTPKTRSRMHMGRNNQLKYARQAKCTEPYFVYFRLVNNKQWSWKALRLLARKSPHFFTQTATNKPLKEYLQTMIGKVSKDLHPTPAGVCYQVHIITTFFYQNSVS